MSFGSFALPKDLISIFEEYDSSLRLRYQVFYGNIVEVIKMNGNFESFYYKRNRKLDAKRVDQIAHFLTQTQIEGYSPGFGIIVFSVVAKTKKPFLSDDIVILDGQHRCAAILNSSMEVQDSVKNQLFRVEFHENDNERFSSFIEINTNVPLPDFYKEDSNLVKECAELFASTLEKTYKNVMKKSQRPQVPHLNATAVKEYAFHSGIFSDQLVISKGDVEATVSHCMRLITNFEQRLRLYSTPKPGWCLSSLEIKKYQINFEKAKTKGCCLGLIPNNRWLELSLNKKEKRLD